MAAKTKKLAAGATRTRVKAIPKSRAKPKSRLRFTVVVEFLVGLLGIYGIGRLLAGRIKEARWFLIVSLLLVVPLDFTPRMIGDEYALWAPWVAKAILGFLSAAHLSFVLDRARPS